MLFLHSWQALKTTLTTCIEKLSECFGGDDVEQMRVSIPPPLSQSSSPTIDHHYKFIIAIGYQATTEADQKAFLVRIMDGKVTAEAANR